MNSMHTLDDLYNNINTMGRSPHKRFFEQPLSPLLQLPHVPSFKEIYEWVQNIRTIFSASRYTLSHIIFIRVMGLAN